MLTYCSIAIVILFNDNCYMCVKSGHLLCVSKPGSVVRLRFVVTVTVVVYNIMMPKSSGKSQKRIDQYKWFTTKSNTDANRPSGTPCPSNDVVLKTKNTKDADDCDSDSLPVPEQAHPVHIATVITANPVASSTIVSESPTPLLNEVEVVASKSFAGDVLLSIGPAPDLNEKSPSQPRLKKFPATKYGSASRSFSSTWYKGRPWLEYSVEKDAAYCFPCRVFGVNPSSTTFTEEGYKDWKHALDGRNDLDGAAKNQSNKNKLKGFAKHASGKWHVNNLTSWREKERRESTGMTLESVVCKLDNENRKWVEVIFHVIRYLAAEGLPLRGKMFIITYIFHFYNNRTFYPGASDVFKLFVLLPNFP